MEIDSARETALKIIYDINEKGAYSNIAIDRRLKNGSLREIDRAFITDIVYGTIQWKMAIDRIIERFSNIRLKKVSPWILNILRMGVYQLVYMDKVPESAVCNESVKLAKKYGHSGSAGYVNAVLRNIARRSGEIEYPDKEKDYIGYLSVRYSHPAWMIEKWEAAYGRDFTESLLASNNSTPDFSIRTNTLKIDRDKLAEELRQAGIPAENGRYAEEALIIRTPSAVSRLEAFKKGYFQVQDESSMLAVKILDPRPGELVMDVCAAPGGKTSHIAQLMRNEGVVVARDINGRKLELVKEASGRLGISIIRTEVFDASALDANFLQKADRVLADVPCSGLGIIRRKPDIKWKRAAGELDELAKLQAAILRTVSQYVRPGGVLVYSTCTINPGENENIADAFIRESEGAFEMEDIAPLLPEKLKKPETKIGRLRLAPNSDGTDGFFIARMRRVEG